MTAGNIYSVVDVETTGGKSSTNRIMEIAIVKTDGYKIIDTYSTLINPHRRIDKYVVKLTGITDNMVANAPDFSDVIEKIEKFTKKTIFVAHNVPFDYSIIKKEYRLVNKVFKRNKVCTVQLSRKFLKEQESFSLGKLTNNLGIELKDRHRAFGDAEATAKLLHYIINKVGEENIIKQTSQQNQIIEFKGELTSDIIEELPEESGTFKFLDKNKKTIYIGYSKNIFKDVTKLLIEEAKYNTHFGLFENMFSIDFEVFNSLFISQLSAISEIIKNKPTYNKSKLHKKQPIGVFEKVENILGNPFLIEKNKNDFALWRFSQQKTAKRFLTRIFNIHKIRTPSYARNKKEFEIEYKQKIEELLQKEIYPHRNFFIIREIYFNKIAYIVKIENFIYRGFGKIDLENFDQRIESLNDCIKLQTNNQTIQKVVRKYVLKAKGIKIVKF